MKKMKKIEAATVKSKPKWQTLCYWNLAPIKNFASISSLDSRLRKRKFAITSLVHSSNTKETLFPFFNQLRHQRISGVTMAILSQNLTM